MIALGGGATGSESVRAALASHTVVHLEVEPRRPGAAHPARAGRSPATRGRFAQLHGDRAAVYESVADAVLPPG